MLLQDTFCAPLVNPNSERCLDVVEVATVDDWYILPACFELVDVVSDIMGDVGVGVDVGVRVGVDVGACEDEGVLVTLSMGVGMDVTLVDTVGAGDTAGVTITSFTQLP